MSRQTDFVTTMQTNVNLLGRVIDHSRSLLEQWFAEGYGVGGPDAITDADLADFGGLTVADVTTAVNLLQQVVNLNDNLPVAQGDHASTIAKLRTTLT